MRKTIIKALSATLVFGTVLASASSLGGLTAQGIGAEDSAITACDANGVQTAYDPTWDASAKRYEVDTVTVAGIADSCDGKLLKVTVTDSDGTVLGSASGTVPVSEDVAHTLTLSSGASSEVIGGVHVSLS